MLAYALVSHCSSILLLFAYTTLDFLVEYTIFFLRVACLFCGMQFLNVESSPLRIVRRGKLMFSCHNVFPVVF